MVEEGDERRILAAAREALRDVSPDEIVELLRSATCAIARADLAENDRLLHDLGERAKELAALHAVARLLQDESLSVPQILQGVAAALPSALQHCDVAVARVRFGDASAATPGHAQTPWTLREAFHVGDGRPGSIEVAYLEERPPADEGPFLAEERALLETLADMISVTLDRRQAEERLALAVTAGKVSVWEWDLATGRLTWPGRKHRPAELDSGLTAQSYDDFMRQVHPDDQAKVRAAIDVALHDPAKAGRYDAEFRVHAPGGGFVLLRSGGQVLLDDSGRPDRMVGVATNVTERRGLEDQLRQSQKMEAVGRLAGGIAHDFNNLLTVIGGYGELTLSSLPADGPEHAWVAEITQASARAAALTRQLLAFSRKQVLHPQVLDLNTVVRDMERLLRRLIGEDVTLVTSPQDKLGRVSADPGQVEQVIANLAVNARDAMPQGGTLTIETMEVDLDAAYVKRHEGLAAGRYVCLAVSDTGTGMDAGTQGHLFEPFFTTKEQGKGTGLGLSTVYGIVKQSGGHVACYSELGQGTTFKVYLPRVARHPARATLFGAPQVHVRGNESILVVEDESAVRGLVCSVLARNGYAVIEARSGAEAVAALRARCGPVDLVLTDMVMPGMSGSSLAQKLAEFGAAPRILYMSGYTDAAVVNQGVIGPDTPFIQKPFTADLLLRRVRETLEATPPG